MILYNVTVSVDSDLVDEWLEWMKNVHIPEVMDTGFFDSYKLFKVLLQEEDNSTFSIQYFTSSMARLQLYQAQHAPALKAKHHEKYGDRVVAFRTVLETV